jgi:hypothetical protein
MSQYITTPAYGLSNVALTASLFNKSRDKYKIASQSLDNEADVNAFRFGLGKDDNSAIIVVLIIIAVGFVVFKSVK